MTRFELGFDSMQTCQRATSPMSFSRALTRKTLSLFLLPGSRVILIMIDLHVDVFARPLLSASVPQILVNPLLMQIQRRFVPMA